MNELYTPPGFVEYPRDPKFRRKGTPDRLLTMAKGYTDIKGIWLFYVLDFLYFTGWGALTWFVAIPAIVSLIIAFVLRARLADVCRAKGWPGLVATVAAFVPAVFALLCAARIPGYYIYMALYALTFLAVLGTARVIVFREFRKYDPKLPFTFGARRLGFIIGAMPAVEQTVQVIEVG